MKLDELRQAASHIAKPTTPQEQQALYAHLRSRGIDLANSYHELEMSSRLADIHRDVSFSNSMVQLHSHSFYEILCCTNTCGAEYLVGSERYRLQKGDIIFVSPGISHRPILPEQMAEPYKRDVLWLSLEFMQMIALLSPDWDQTRKRDTDLLRTAGTQWDFLPSLFHRGVLEYEAQLPGWQTSVVGTAMVIAAHLGRAFRDRSTAPLRAEEPELLDRVLAYIEKNLTQKLTLEEVARHFYVSESTISQTFRQKMGVSFHRCVNQRRLIAAKTLILEGALLETVGEQVGFSDYSTFYRAFRQEYGISPRQFRKLQKQEP